MKPFLRFCLIALIAGLGLGAGLGYYDARPWAFKLDAARTSADEASADVEPPGLVIDESTYHFGNMERGTLKRYTFEISNTGKSALEVTFVSNTCKCTAVELNGEAASPGDSMRILPGEAGEATLEWEAKQGAGPFRHGANFKTNDPQLDRFSLEVEGDIVESSTLSPSSLYFGSVQAGAPAKASLYVMSFLEPDIEILDYEIVDNEDLAKRVKLSIEDVPISELPQAQAKDGAKVVAELDTMGGIGSFRGTLELSTNIKQAERLVVPISGFVRGDISIFGTGYNRDAGLLRMDDVRSSEGARVELLVNVRGEGAQTTELNVASVDPPELNVTIGDRTERGSSLATFPLVVEAPMGMRPTVRVGDDDEFGGAGEGEIVLASTHPTTPEVRIRVRLIVKP